MGKRLHFSRYYVAVASVLLLAALLRSKVFVDPSLWYDEYYSASWATMDPLEDALAGIRTIDFHPPLYYLQLWLWAKVASSHTWLLFNSFLLGLVSVAGVMFTGVQLSTKRAGIICGVLAAGAHAATVQSTELRMYVWLMALVPWAAFFSIRLATQDSHRLRTFLSATALSIFIGYSHGTGFLWVATSFLIQCLLLVRTRNLWRALSVIASNALATAALVPWLLHASERAPGHLKPPTIELIWKIATQVFSLQSPSEFSTQLLAVVVALTTLLAICRRDSGSPIMGGVVLTLAFGVAVSTYRPILHPRAFLYLVPLSSLGLGLVFERLLQGDRSRKLLGSLGLTCFLLSSLHASSQFALQAPKISSTTRAVQRLAKMGGTKHPVFARFWGDALAICWEQVGPGSASGPDSPFRCKNKRGMRVVTEPRKLKAERGQTVFEIYKTKYGSRLPRFKTLKKKKKAGYTIAKLQRKKLQRKDKRRRKNKPRSRRRPRETN